MLWVARMAVSETYTYADLESNIYAQLETAFVPMQRRSWRHCYGSAGLRAGSLPILLFPLVVDSTVVGVRAPTVQLQVVSGSIATGEEAVYGPTVRLQVLPSRIFSGEQVLGPTLPAQIRPGVVTTGEAVYGPTVGTVAQVRPNVVGTGEQVYGPILLQPSVTERHRYGRAGLHAPSLPARLSPLPVDNTVVTVYAPTLPGQVRPGAVATRVSRSTDRPSRFQLDQARSLLVSRFTDQPYPFRLTRFLSITLIVTVYAPVVGAQVLPEHDRHSGARLRTCGPDPGSTEQRR